MIITYRKRIFLDTYMCIDKPISTRVICFAFAQGDLLYYKKDRFNYLVISKNDLLSIKEVTQ